MKTKKKVIKSPKCEICKKVIGWSSILNGRIKYFDGVWNCGYKYFCSKKCVNKSK